MLTLINENEDRVHNLRMSHEAHFLLSGFVNKQNFRYWAESIPQHQHERPLHSQKLTVWCAVSSLEIIGPNFFEDESDSAVTVNSERYCEMLANFFPALEEYDHK